MSEEEQQIRWKNMSEEERELRLKTRSLNRDELRKLFWYRYNLSWVPPNQEDEYRWGFIAGVEGQTVDDNPHSFELKTTTDHMRSVLVGWRYKAWELGVESGNDYIEDELEKIMEKK